MYANWYHQTRLGTFWPLFLFYFFLMLPIDWQAMHYLSKLICPVSKNLFHCVIDIYSATEWYHQTRLSTVWPLFFSIFSYASYRLVTYALFFKVNLLPISRNFFHCIIDIYPATKWYHQTRLGRFWPLFFFLFFFLCLLSIGNQRIIFYG